MNVVLLAIGATAVLSFATVVASRWVERLLWRRHLVAHRLVFPRGLTSEQVSNWLSVVGSVSSESPVAFEIVATSRGVQHYLLAPDLIVATLLSGIRSALPGVRVEDASDYLNERPRIRAASEFRLTSTSHPLGAERAESVSQALLGSLQPLARGQYVRLSWLIKGTRFPHPAGLVELPADLARFRRLKHREPLLLACGRIAVGGPSRAAAWSLVYRLHSAVRVMNAPGAAMVRRWLPGWLVADRIAQRALPLLRWPATLNTRELAGLIGVPLTAAHLPGLTLGTARQLPPPPDMPRRGLVVAMSNYPGMKERPIVVPEADRLRHLWLLGPTGVGKSTLLANMALQDAAAGYGLVVVDPKADLVADILARLPKRRLQDVVVLDPAARDVVVGFNILRTASSGHARELVVDNVVAIFGEIWKGSFGPRSTDILRNSLLTLTATRAADGSAFTLAEVAPLLENQAFRRFVTSQPNVPETVRSFWLAYQAMSAKEAASVIGPPLNKLRALTTRSPLQLILGQSVGLDMGEVLRKRQILLVSLNKGLVGADTAALLGSLLVRSLWSAALQRGGLPPSERHPAWAYLDEFQDVLRMGSDLDDALSQARGLGLGFVLAHQFLDQLPRPMQAAVLGTVRSSVVFQLDHDDAKTAERRFQPALSADDLMGLEPHEVAMRLSVGGKTRTPITGTTLPFPDATQDAEAIARTSRERYGLPRIDVEAALRSRIGVDAMAPRQSFGRRRRGAA